MPDFLHVFILPKADVSAEQIEEKMNLATDWYRYQTGLFVVYTTGTPEVWYERLSDFVKPDGKLFICKLEITVRQGWMAKSFWDWLRKSREKTVS